MARCRRDQTQNRGGRAGRLALGASDQRVSPAFSDERRLAFGRFARVYDRARPSYPASAIEEVLAHATVNAGDLALEVGAGTGKATVLFAERGLRVLALEPDAAMAALARRAAARRYRGQRRAPVDGLRTIVCLARSAPDGATR